MRGRASQTADQALIMKEEGGMISRAHDSGLLIGTVSVLL